MPANAGLTIEKNVLRNVARAPGAARSMPIDRFLKSLARECGSRAFAVILSGTGTDGSAGIQAIQAAGGVTFAQDHTAAGSAAMPKTAEATGCVDFVLPPDRIAAEIARLSRSSGADTCEISKLARPEEGHWFGEIYNILHIATGIDFSLYRESTITRRILRRLSARSIPNLREYAKQLDSDPGELRALQQDLLISVTRFFRNPLSFEALKRVALPRLTQDRPKGAPIRGWVPGCATGEEAYSIAIAIEEHLEEGGHDFPVVIFASDISESAINRVRSGRYLANIEADVSPARLREYFVKSEDGYQIGKRIRETCVFSRHNLIEDPPFQSWI